MLWYMLYSIYIYIYILYRLNASLCSAELQTPHIILDSCQTCLALNRPVFRQQLLCLCELEFKFSWGVESCRLIICNYLYGKIALTCCVHPFNLSCGWHSIAVVLHRNQWVFHGIPRSQDLRRIVTGHVDLMREWYAEKCQMSDIVRR